MKQHKPRVTSAVSPTVGKRAAVHPLADEVRPGQSVELLKELHILTREGKLNQDSRRKLKQVYHLYQFIEKLLLELPDSGKGATLADHGAGKSYLGFIIYDLFFKTLKSGHIYGIETRSELVQKSRELADRLGFDGMSFLNLSVAESTGSDALPDTIDVVTALHACDTATDDAIAFGLKKRARYLVTAGLQIQAAQHIGDLAAHLAGVQRMAPQLGQGRAAQRQGLARVQTACNLCLAAGHQHQVTGSLLQPECDGVIGGRVAGV